ncbi:MAG: chemotaxis protein CheW [Deltaproteobacteria bacterium]|nr:chemotaxis protein CheW [Deltaproteobacteria bacterium]
MPTSPAERRALLFTAGGIPLALRLPIVREIVPIPPGAAEVEVRGQVVPAVPLAVAMGLGGGPGRFAVLTEAAPPVALRVDAVHAIVDLKQTEVFQLPVRTPLPQPAPFQGAVVAGGVIYLELALTTAGWVPLEPALDDGIQAAQADFAAGRELVFERAGTRYAVPISLLLRVVESPHVFPVPLAPAVHRGLLYHERAIFPVFDLAALYGGGPAPGATLAVLVDAAGTAIAVLADRVAREGDAGEVVRPAWDALFPT